MDFPLWMFLHACQSSLPAVGRGDDQRVAHAGPPQAAAQLVEEAVGQRLQGQHHQQGAEEQAVGWLQIKSKEKQPPEKKLNNHSKNQR